MKLILTGMLLFVCTHLTFAQKIAVDNKGKSVFTSYSQKQARLEFSDDEPLSVTGSFRNFFHPFKIDTSRTVDKASGWFLTASLLNSGAVPMLSNLDKLRPGLGLKLGRQVTLDKVYNLKGTYGANAYGMNVLLNLDNVNLMNTNSPDSAAHRVCLVTYGVEGNWIHYFASTDKILFALNASFTKTWNDDDLLNFQNNADVTFRSSVVALEEFKGRYGPLQRDVSKFRVAASLPFYFWRLNPVPYTVLNAISGSMPKYYVGIFINVLTEERKEAYSIPSSIGIGFDKELGGDVKKKGINVFVKGSLSIGKFKK